MFADPDAAALVFPGGTVLIDGAVCDPQGLSVGGQATITASSAPVDLAFTVDGEWLTGTVATVDLGEDRSLVLVDGAPADTDLPAGAWALTDGRVLRLTRRTPAPAGQPCATGPLVSSSSRTVNSASLSFGRHAGPRERTPS
ncbi:hypothetical protein OG239_00820 [Streptomyces sp. NBC_00868]|uniref:hypothetical protein n=1 Tax=Streptomyces sp. NBC_00868 TaxID=2903683 RepID=UPI003867BDC5|nr:hypothetical protein OG239_00820 [Streptomyces sp. NBC_00868]